MAERKETPDVLGELLGGGSALPEVPSSPTRAPAAERSRRRPAGRSAERTAKTEQTARWEHRVASFQEHRGWHLRYVDGVEVRDWTSGPLIHEYVAQCGEEGWELAGVAAGRPVYGLSDCYQLYFKRREQAHND